ncbi:hypothetical protein QQP08_010569 [Theobroma cacao]|nr:hypothetical protein QQP08_010569 [Theobroma cacao]
MCFLKAWLLCRKNNDWSNLKLEAQHQIKKLFGLKIRMGVLLLGNSCSCSLWAWKKRSPFSLNCNGNNSKRVLVKAFFFDPSEVPILKQAVKEPVAFMGGMFAGILRLDLNEDPLKEWVARTVEASAIDVEGISGKGFREEEDTPQQIEIE